MKYWGPFHCYHMNMSRSKQQFMQCQLLNNEDKKILININKSCLTLN